VYLINWQLRVFLILSKYVVHLVCSSPHTTLYFKRSFRQTSWTPSNIFEQFHSWHICYCELPKIYFESIFTHPLNPECPLSTGTLSLTDLLWQVFSDLIMSTGITPSARNQQLSLFSPLIVKCSNAQFSSPHQQVSQRNELQGIESRDWLDGDEVCEA